MALFLLTEAAQTSNLLLIKPLPERASQVLDRSGLYLRGAYSPYEERPPVDVGRDREEERSAVDAGRDREEE